MQRINCFIEGDIIQVLKEYPNEFFDLIIADYPFKIKGDYIKFVEETAREFYRTLKATGSLYIINNPANLFKTAHAFKDFIFRNAIILKRHYKFCNPKLFCFKHNQIWFFTKTKEYYFNNMNFSDVWDDIHYAVKGKNLGSIPKEIARRIILCSSREGDIILDAFCGLGTISLVAKELKRNFVGVDISLPSKLKNQVLVTQYLSNLSQ